MPDALDLISATPFSFKGRDFLCGAMRTEAGLYQPVTLCRAVGGTADMAELPLDTEPYASAAEAVRHAEQQAVRWTHDRTGDGQGRF